MVEFFNIATGGIFGGCVLALLALGYSVIYSATGILNLAQGGYIVFGALFAYRGVSNWHLPTIVAVLLAAVVVGAAAAVTEIVVLRGARSRLSTSNLLLVMAGLLVLYQGICFVWFGSDPVSLRPFSSTSSVDVNGVRIPTQGFWLCGLLLLTVGSVGYFLARTTTGKAVRAAQASPFSASICGIPVERVVLLTSVGSGALGALAGAFVLPYNSIASASAFNYALLGLVAVTLGGLGSVYGAVLGGLALGLGEALISGYISTLYGEAMIMAVLILTLAYRPEGLLTRGDGRRAESRAVRLGKVPLPPRLPRVVSRGGMVLCLVALVILPSSGLLGTNLRTANIVGIFALTVVGLDLLSGTAGQVSLGQAGFMAVGAYASADLMLKGWPPIMALLVGVLASMAVATVFSQLTRRLSGTYLGAVTLAFGLLVEQLATGLHEFGGSGGLVGVPSFSVGGLSFDTDERFFYLIWALVAIGALVVARINASYFGRLLKSLHGDPVAAEMSGFSVSRGKLVALLVASIYASVAGTLYACYFHFLSPDMVGSSASVNLIVMVAVGGAGTVIGPIIGAAVLTYLPTVSQGFATWFSVVEGTLLIVILRFFPSGLFGALANLFRIAAPVISRLGVASRDEGDDPMTATQSADPIDSASEVSVR